MKLLSPIKLGNITLRNRIAMPAMHLIYTPEGEVTDRLIDFYEERAKGGAGLIIIGGCIIDEYSGPPFMLKLTEDKYIPGLKKLTGAVRKHGAAICAQLYQAGRYSHSFMIGRQAIAPSPVLSKFTNEEPREMTLEDIDYVIGNFAKGAVRAKEAGFDAVEILGSAGYLICQFLSSVTNKRTDKYGGSFENRMRFGLEVADAVRKVVGPDFTVITRLAGNDFISGSNTNKETALFAARMEEHGVDGFNVTGGWHETRVPQLPMEVPRGGYVYLAQGIKQAVSVPVIACNRINNPMLAEKILRQGSADIIGFARGLIADPYLPEKIAQGKFDDITQCIGCNQGCFDHVFLGQPVECMVNPRAGHEKEIPLNIRTDSPKKVIVIGGGPAGLSAAKTAAESGHSVTLYEKSNTLGGQLNIAGAPDERKEFLNLKNTLEKQTENAGVEIHTTADMDAESILREKADAVIIATGGKPIKPAIPGIDSGNVVQAWDVLSGKADVGNEIIIIGGGAVGIETALFLARIGTISPETLQFLLINDAEDVDTLKSLSKRGIKHITIIEMLPSAGKDIGKTTRWVAMDSINRYGVKILTSTKALEIRPDGILTEKDGIKELIKCDTVVLAVGTASENILENKLKDKVRTIVVGDAQKPRKAYDAIHEGFHAARSI